MIAKEQSSDPKVVPPRHGQKLFKTPRAKCPTGPQSPARMGTHLHMMLRQHYEAAIPVAEVQHPPRQLESPNVGPESRLPSGDKTWSQNGSSNSSLPERKSSKASSRRNSSRSKQRSRTISRNCPGHRRTQKRKARSPPRCPCQRAWLSLHHLQHGAACRTPRLLAIVP